MMRMKGRMCCRRLWRHRRRWPVEGLDVSILNEKLEWGATHSVNRNNLRHDAHTHIQMARVSNDIIIVRLHIHSHGRS